LTPASINGVLLWHWLRSAALLAHKTAALVAANGLASTRLISFSHFGARARPGPLLTTAPVMHSASLVRASIAAASYGLRLDERRENRLDRRGQSLPDRDDAWQIDVERGDPTTV
jgi:hypothetical protein